MQKLKIKSLQLSKRYEYYKCFKYTIVLLDLKLPSNDKKYK